MWRKRILFVLVLSLIGAVAWSQGQGSGNGGGVVVCKDAVTGHDSTIELADIYEGRRTYGFTYRLFEKTKTKDLHQLFFGRLRYAMPNRMFKLYKEIRNNEMHGKTLGIGQLGISKTPDVKGEMTDDVTLDPGCRIEQVINFLDGFGMIFSSKLFEDNHISGDDFARFLPGLLEHETLYRIARIRCSDQDSKRVRAIVAYLFSDQYNDKLFTKLIHRMWKGKSFDTEKFKQQLKDAKPDS